MSVWTIQVTDEQDRYTGITSWDTASGRLLSTCWENPTVHADNEEPLAKEEAKTIGALRFSQLVSSPICRILRSPEPAAHAWILCYGSGEETFRLKIDNISGRLIAAETRKTKQPG